MTDSELALQRGSQRERRRKHSFRKLPGGRISGSTTNPETIGRNRRRQKLPPLRAELERIRCNKANRISSAIRKLKNEPVWQLLSEADQEAAIQEVRDSQEIRYRKDKEMVQEQYQKEAGGPQVKDRASCQQPQSLAALPKTITQAATPTSPTSISRGGSTRFSNFTTGHRGSCYCCCRRAAMEAESKDGGEKIDSGGLSENGHGADCANALREDSELVSPNESGLLSQDNLQLLIAAIEQSQ